MFIDISMQCPHHSAPFSFIMAVKEFELIYLCLWHIIKTPLESN